MNILIVNQHVSDVVGGSETQCHWIALKLAELGHSVTYGVSHPRKTHYELPYAVRTLPSPFVKSFAAALRDLQPDVIYWRFNKRYLLRSLLAARRSRVKFVLAVSHINDLRAFTAKPFAHDLRTPLKLFIRSLRFTLNAVVSAFNYIAIDRVDGVVFQHEGQVPRVFNKQHAVIYNSYPRIQSHPLNSDVPYVLWVANIKRSKNPEVLIRLSRDLQDLGVEFRMVGAIQESNYNSVLHKGALPPNLLYMGYQDQDAVHALINGSIFVVHTCSEEGFPNIFIQSWLQKKAVVSLGFDPGGLLTDNRIGICSGSYDAFRHDVSRLIRDEVLRESLGERGFGFASVNCDPERNFLALASFLETVVSS